MVSNRLFICLLIASSYYLSAGYHSQYKQDQYMNEWFFHNMRDGIFVDIGAHNGSTYSNSLFYEEDLGWKGICVEPMPEVFAQLQQCRKAICVQACITNTTGIKDFLRVTSPHIDTEMLSGLLDKYDPKHLQRVNHEIAHYGGKKEVIQVMCYTLNDLVKEYGLPYIDYLSIDTEGGELDILKSINFDTLAIHIIDVENNFPNDASIRLFMESKGFRFVARVNCDEVYENMQWQPVN